MNTEQLRAEFEAWATGRCELYLVNPAGRYSSATTQFAWEAYQAGRAAVLADHQQRGGDVLDDMRAAVRFAPSSAYWSERLREFFGPDAREGIDALEKQLREARAALHSQDREDAATEATGGDENGGHRLVEPDHETAMALADAPRSLRNYVAALRSAIALQSQDKEDAERFRFCLEHGFPQKWEEMIKGNLRHYWTSRPGSQDEFSSAIEAIDHARRNEEEL